MNKGGICSGFTPLNPCAAWLVVIFGSVLVAALFLLGPKLQVDRLLAAAVVAMGATALLEVVRHYWTDRFGPGTPAGTLRVLALWFGLWVLSYLASLFHDASAQIPGCFGAACKATNSGGGSGNSNEGISLVTAALGFVLAVTTLVATKVASDAKVEVQAVNEELKKSKDIAFMAEIASFDLKLRRLLAWRVEIKEAEEKELDQKAAARLVALDKNIKALKVPMEEAPRWGTSGLDHLALQSQAIQAHTLLMNTPELSAGVRELLGHSGSDDHLRELGVALGHFLEHLRSRHPNATVSENDAWEALARLSQALKKL